MQIYRKSGLLTAIGPGVQFEYETQTCSHHNGVSVVASNDPDATVDRGGHCLICDHWICSECADRGTIHGCENFNKRLDEAIARQRFRESVCDE